MEKSVELVFVPAPWISHLVPFMEFAKLLIGRDHRIHVTVLVMDPTYRAGEARQYIRSISSSESRIRFVDLPLIDPPTVEIDSPEGLEFRTIESYAPSVRRALAEIVSSTRTELESVRVAGLVLDLGCVAMVDDGAEFGVNSYIFFASSAASLNVSLYIPNRDGELELSGPELAIPGFANSVPQTVLPPVLFDRNGGYEFYARLYWKFRDVRGIIVNSLSELEPYAFSCFSDEEFQSQNRNPPVYGVGPVLNLEPRAHQASREKIIDWLDNQPPASVVFLCFGTVGGGFGAPQVREIALALEHGGFMFLWIIHATTDMLPEGFMERIGGRGVICEWAPQAEVLAHVAIGGFVSHCGWNSVLESLWSGVPIATWPLRAEQQLNAFLLVKELGGLAVEMRLDSRMGGNLVPADEIERAVKRLMDGDDEVKNKVNEMGTIMKKALMDGGSSFASLGLLIKDMMIGNNE